MSTTFNIDKKSKLFQKFLQAKHKDIEHPTSTNELQQSGIRPLTESYQTSNSNHHSGNQEQIKKPQNTSNSSSIQQQKFNFAQRFDLCTNDRFSTNKQSSNKEKETQKLGLSDLIKKAFKEVKQEILKNEDYDSKSIKDDVMKSEREVHNKSNYEERLFSNDRQKDDGLGKKYQETIQQPSQEDSFENIPQSIQRKTTSKEHQKSRQKEQNEEQYVQEYNENNQRDADERDYQTDMQEEIDNLKEKINQLRFNEDNLVRETMQLKEKLQTQLRQKIKREEIILQLTHKNKENQQQLIRKQTSFKRKTEEAQHWQSQYNIIKQEIASLKSEIDILQNYNHEQSEQTKALKRQIHEKDQIISDLRLENKKQQQQIAQAKHYLFTITVKLFNAQQQIEKLKLGSSQRNVSSHFPHKIPAQTIPNCDAKRQQLGVQMIPEVVPQEKPAQRKRQFARERSVTAKYEKSSRIESKLQSPQLPLRKQSVQNERPKAPISPQKQRSTSPLAQNRKIERIQHLQNELEELIELKVINGKTRRRRIQIQRQLMQLLEDG